MSDTAPVMVSIPAPISAAVSVPAVSVPAVPAAAPTPVPSQVARDPDGGPSVDLSVDRNPRIARATLRVGLVDDHRVMLDGLTTWLGAEASDLRVCAAVASYAELLGHPEHPVDVALLDLELGDGVSPAVKIVELAAAGVAVVVVSSFADPRLVRECLAAGACGYVPKSDNAAEIVLAIRAAAQGESHLTPALAAMLVADDHDDESVPALSPQERRALVLYASGLPLKTVARQLDISVETAKTYLARVREKYAQAGREARTKIALHRRAVEDGLLADAPPSGS
jgi:DNA-binding NarL/FixJ family response regulator